MKTYAAECFTHRLYWYFFLANTCVFSSRLSFMFMSQRNNLTLGMSLQQIGDYGVWYVTIGMFLQFPAGWLADRFHPLRVYIIATILATFGIIAQCVWIFRDFGPAGNLRYLYVTGLCSMPLLLIADAAELPMYMRLLPKDRYGQFASANAMVRSFARIFLSVLVGMFIAWLGHWYGDRRFTWITAWQLFFQLIAIAFLLLLYRQWQLNGGNRDYIPPGTTLESAALNLQAATPTTSV